MSKVSDEILLRYPRYGEDAAPHLAAARGRNVSEVSGMEPESESAVITFDDGATLRLFHQEDCCETVEIVEVIGDPSDLVGHPLAMCEMVKNESAYSDDEHIGSTWTFYKLGGLGGYVTLRWLGKSNGYYSEEVYVEFRDAEAEG